MNANLSHETPEEMESGDGKELEHIELIRELARKFLLSVPKPHQSGDSAGGELSRQIFR